MEPSIFNKVYEMADQSVISAIEVWFNEAMSSPYWQILSYDVILFMECGNVVIYKYLFNNEEKKDMRKEFGITWPF